MNKNYINLVLFGLVAILLIIASKGGFSSTTPWPDIGFNMGVSMLGGIVCGVALYGINFMRFKKPNDRRQFLRIKRNQDMGEKYWINFIKYLEKDPSPVWFVGNKHLAWIDEGFRYRKEIKKKIIQRINAAKQSKSSAGWEIYIILVDREAASLWKKFIIEEVNVTTNYLAERPDLIKIGIVPQTIIKYSIVAYNRGVVITPYTSEGRTAESPTIALKPNSDVSKLYLNDLQKILNSISPNDFLQLYNA
jgi:hypothetical protein